MAPSHRSAVMPLPDTCEEIQERNSSSKVQTRVNRLKRAKKTAGTDTNPELCSEVIRTSDHWPPVQSSTKNVDKSKLGQALKENSGCCFSSKCLLVTERHPKQSKLHMMKVKESCLTLNEAKMCLSRADPQPDINDLCEDDENNSLLVTNEYVKDHYEHTYPPQVIKSDDGMSRINEDKFQTPSHTFAQTVHCHSFKPPTILKSHREMRSGWREDFSDKICEELLAQIQAQNRCFAVHRFFSLLLKQRNQFEKSLTGLGKITHSIDAPGFGKRKQDLVLDDQPLKRPRWSGEPSRDSVCVSASQCANAHNPHSSHCKASSKSRLSVSRRRKQQNTAPPAVLHPRQNVCCTVEKTVGECVMREEDVLWTEKYQPQHSDGVIGNSASVRKLHSWLKEWRMKANVEDRRRKQEQCRMQEENSESWDCGDFEGESGIGASETELCNTMLIVGPAGIGKTAAVYACAEELGFKVFEVNSSSLRSGQLVLSQLREATQSHQVGVIRPDTLKPQSGLSINTVTLSAPVKPPSATPIAVSKEEASRRVVAPTRKRSWGIPKKKSTAPAITIKHFFTRTDEPVNKSTELHQDHQADSVKPDVIIDCDANAEGTSEGSVLNTKEPQLDRENKTAPISLILFEEVDIIFSEDVGFLTAVKTLMTTTKRPIILTTNDPVFSKTFNAHFEKISFRTPSVETTKSYLQCVCVVENMWPDPEDLHFLLEECKGDVRRSVLELELWACSGGGHAKKHTLNKTLMCRSWSELHSCGYVDVLVKNWMMGRSLFYLNLGLLFTLHSRTSENIDRNMLKAEKSTKFKTKREKDRASSSLVLKNSRTGKLSATNKLKMTNRSFSKNAQVSARIERSESLSTEENLSKLAFCCLESLAQFFDTMSFLDSCIYKQQLQVSGQCQPGPLGWMGGQLTDSLVDELREEEVNTHLERCYELQSVLEGLGFHQCKAELSEVWKTVEKLKEGTGEERFTQLIDGLLMFETPDASFFQNEPGQHSVVQKSRRKVLNKLLSSKAFCCHGNKRAIAVDYLPVLGSICRTQSMKQQNRSR